MYKKKLVVCLCMLISSGWLMAADVSSEEELSQLNEQAASFYTNNQWQSAISSYSLLLKKQPENEQAWYRLTQSHLNLNQGQLALEASEKLNEATQVPASLVQYQKAQAHNILGNEEMMWQSLRQAANLGFRNINELNNNPVWKKFSNSSQLSEINQLVDKNIRPCMYDDTYRQFDFWLGQWEVYGNQDKTGRLFGHNSITRSEQGCLIMEQWKGAGGSTGTSMNYYDGTLNKWVQRWVSGGGTVIDYSGGLIKQKDNNESMQLVGKIYYASNLQQPQIRDFRGTWTPLNDGVVQQFFEESIDGGQTWYVWFNGFYFPIKQEESKNE